MQVSFKPDKNKGYYTWRPMYIYDGMSMNYSHNEKCIRKML